MEWLIDFVRHDSHRSMRRIGRVFVFSTFTYNFLVIAANNIAQDAHRHSAREEITWNIRNALHCEISPHVCWTIIIISTQFATACRWSIEWQIIYKFRSRSQRPHSRLICVAMHRHRQRINEVQTQLFRYTQYNVFNRPSDKVNVAKQITSDQKDKVHIHTRARSHLRSIAHSGTLDGFITNRFPCRSKKTM